jgi:hypothetical protein
MRGQTVCKMHGGKAPQALRTAAERLAAMVDPALSALAHLVDEAESDMVRLAAIKDVLDRAGYKPVERQQIEQAGDYVVRYVNDWRRPVAVEVGDHPALPPSGPDQGET